MEVHNKFNLIMCLKSKTDLLVRMNTVCLPVCILSVYALSTLHSSTIWIEVSGHTSSLNLGVSDSVQQVFKKKKTIAIHSAFVNICERIVCFKELTKHVPVIGGNRG